MRARPEAALPLVLPLSGGDGGAGSVSRARPRSSGLLTGSGAPRAGRLGGGAGGRRREASAEGAETPRAAAPGAARVWAGDHPSRPISEGRRVIFTLKVWEPRALVSEVGVHGTCVACGQ
ncbi:small integral membrane protein 15 isoform X1 [Equus asinus]|uniref:small integral membrane protein 15 isoform X1 n=1 Tax=Equus asinus TaxID=9793 RepID=UPI0038F679BA